MSYNVKWTDKEGVTDNAMGIESLSEALEIADTGNDIYGDVTTQIIDDRNGLVVWNSTDSPALQEYIELDHEQWQSLQHGHHQKSEKPSVYFDIDGTLGKWYPDRRGMSPEELLDPANHYFRNIEKNDMMINLAQYLSEQGVDVCIMSASYKDMIRDKWEWVQEHLPFIPEENICFSPVGADKSEFVKGNADISILIDDYNKNLEQWQGIAVKALNGINSHQEKFEEIDFTAWEQKLHNARELSLEYDMPELLDKVAYDAFRDVKRAGDKIIDILNSEKEQTKLIARAIDTYNDGDQSWDTIYEYSLNKQGNIYLQSTDRDGIISGRAISVEDFLAHYNKIEIDSLRREQASERYMKSDDYGDYVQARQGYTITTPLTDEKLLVKLQEYRKELEAEAEERRRKSAELAKQEKAENTRNAIKSINSTIEQGKIPDEYVYYENETVPKLVLFVNGEKTGHADYITEWNPTYEEEEYTGEAMGLYMNFDEAMQYDETPCCAWYFKEDGRGEFQINDGNVKTIASFNLNTQEVDLGNGFQPCNCSTPEDMKQYIYKELGINMADREKMHEFQYQLLGRLQSDCEYYLGFGNKNPDKLWAKNEVAQIEKMLEIYDALPVKPEWLTREQIYDYSNRMDVPALATYETYKKEWIAEHIDDQTMANTEALYENDENAVDLTFDEYVQEYGFTDGSCYASFAEFRENEYKTYELADKIEQFMFERGEYDYSPEEHISWVKNNDSREDVTKSIRKDIENNNVDALINYLDVEESVMSGRDELCDVAIELMDKLKEFTDVPADVSIKHIIEPYDDYGEEIPSIDVVFVKYKDSNDYVLAINDEEEAVIRAEDNSKLLEYAIAEHNQSVSALLNDETISYHFFAQKTENDVKLNVYFQDNSGEPSDITVEVPLTKEENERLLQYVREYDERISGKNPISFDVSEIYGTSGQFYLLDLSGDVAVEAVNRAVLDSPALKIELDKFDGNVLEMLAADDYPYEFYGQRINEDNATLRFALPEHEIDAKVELTQNEQEHFLEKFSTYDEKQNKSQHKPKKHEKAERE